MHSKHDTAIKKIQNVLVEWDPLQDLKYTVEDLKEYSAEAADIYVGLAFVSGEDEAIATICEIINDALSLELSLKECQAFGSKIWGIYQQYADK